jgi:hypothetical protein
MEYGCQQKLSQSLALLKEWVDLQEPPRLFTHLCFAPGCRRFAIHLGRCITHRPALPVCSHCYQALVSTATRDCPGNNAGHAWYLDYEWDTAEDAFFDFLRHPQGTFEPLEPNPERELQGRALEPFRRERRPTAEEETFDYAAHRRAT